jgi:hypothetical protein
LKWGYTLSFHVTWRNDDENHVFKLANCKFCMFSCFKDHFRCEALWLVSVVIPKKTALFQVELVEFGALISTKFVRRFDGFDYTGALDLDGMGEPLDNKNNKSRQN